MSRPAYTKAFRRALAALRLGKCPREDDLKHVFEQGWDTHLGPSELELAKQCKQGYELED